MRIALCLLAGAALSGGCDELMKGEDRETLFLARRVDELEGKVRELEREVNRLRILGGGSGVSAAGSGGVGSGAFGASGPGAATVPGDGAGPALVAEQLKSEADRANIFLLKAKQLQVASRADLPRMIAELGIDAPEVTQLQVQIQGLEKERSQLLDPDGMDAAQADALDAELDKLRFRLELASEGVRRRVIEEGRQMSARMQAPPEEAGAGATPAGETRTP